MAWWKRGRCQSCNKKFKKHDNKHELGLKTADGNTRLIICDECAEFWDMSAEVLQQGRRND